MLHYTAGWADGRGEVIKVLIEAGAEVEAKQMYAYTPLQCAVVLNMPLNVQALIDCGADIDAEGYVETRLLNGVNGWGCNTTLSHLSSFFHLSSFVLAFIQLTPVIFLSRSLSVDYTCVFLRSSFDALLLIQGDS